MSERRDNRLKKMVAEVRARGLIPRARGPERKLFKLMKRAHRTALTLGRTRFGRRKS